MKPNETLVFDYNSDYVKCVRHRPITKISSCNRFAQDITQLEFFGYFKNESEIHDLSYDDLIFMRTFIMLEQIFMAYSDD